MRSFDDVNRLFDEMDRTFDQFRTEWGREFGTPRLEPTRSVLERGSRPSSEPAATLTADGDASMLVMDLPGFEKTDIDLRYHDGVLSVRAHADVDEDTGSYHATRSRRIDTRHPIPKAVVADEITATYHNGVLEVQFPIVGSDRNHQGHRIDID